MEPRCTCDPWGSLGLPSINRRQHFVALTRTSFEPHFTYVAARNGHAEVVRLLLQEGADINTEDEEREIALDRAVSRRGEVRAKLGQESPHTKGLEAVVRLLRKARRNVEGSRSTKQIHSEKRVC